MYLYRYRSVHALLGEDRQELETQTIYFADQKQLNDPVEGFRDIFWFGDEIVWKNLIRHYLLNLFQTASLAYLAGNDLKRTDSEGWIFGIPSDLPDAPIRNVFREFEVEVLTKLPIVQLLIYLGSCQRRVRADELRLYLTFIHPLAIETLFGVLKRHRLMPEEAFPAEEIRDKNSADNFQTLIQLLPQMQVSHLEVFAQIAKTARDEMRLIDQFNWGVDHPNAHWIFVVRDFIFSILMRCQNWCINHGTQLASLKLRLTPPCGVRMVIVIEASVSNSKLKCRTIKKQLNSIRLQAGVAVEITSACIAAIGRILLYQLTTLAHFLKLISLNQWELYLNIKCLSFGF